MMIKNASTSLLVASCLGLIAGCSDSVDNVPYCSESEGGLCQPPGFPFVTELGPASDACTAPDMPRCMGPKSLTTTLFTQPQTGQGCMKGAVAGPDGFAWLIATVSRWNKENQHIVNVFDAKALGITGLEFKIDTPPTTGMSLFATTVVKRDCNLPSGCLNGWDLMTGPRSNLVKVLDHTETVSAPFINFSNPDPNLKFDASALGHFIFVIPPGPYDFCISDFKFLDVQGNEVTPNVMANAAVTGG